MKKKFLISLLAYSTILIGSQTCFANTLTEAGTQEVTADFSELENNEEFQQLSSDEQDELKDILQDEEKVKAIMSEFKNHIGDTETVSTSTIDSDIKYVSEQEDEIDSDDRAPSSYYGQFVQGHHVSGYDSAVFKGVTIVKISGEMYYDYYYGQDVEVPTDANFWVSRNYVPIITISTSLPMKYITDGKAAASSTFEFGVGLDDLDVDYETDKLTLYGDKYGNASAYISYNV